jgi:hypothetical protein
MYIFLIYYKKTIESNIYDLLDEFRECSLTDKIWFYITATVKGNHIYNCYYYQNPCLSCTSTVLSEEICFMHG